MADIKTWIKGQLKAGIPPEKIKQGLIERGYSPNLINEVPIENTKGRNTNLTTTLMPQPSNIKFILLVILLAGTSFVLGGAFTFSLLNTNTDTEPETIVQFTSLVTYDELLELNPQLVFYSKGGTCREQFGYIHAFGDAVNNKQPRIDILTLNNEVIGFLSIWPAAQGWYSYADQPEGEPTSIAGDESYTKTIYLKAPPTVEDCASAQN